MKLAAMFIVLALAGWGHGQGRQNLVYNGDFEADSAQSPPPGWAMWGAQQWKIPADFTRDPTVAHGGKASFRIHHPRNTQGYIVTAPERAIRPKEGMAYTVSFWARASAPVRTTFGFTAYESLKPFRDAPSPGAWPIEVGTQWKQYSFDIREGARLRDLSGAEYYGAAAAVMPLPLRRWLAIQVKISPSL